MSDDSLGLLLSGNARHRERLDEGTFDEHRAGQQPPVVSVCCSDSRVSQEGMWDVQSPGTLFTVGNIGNRVSDRVDGGAVLDGSVAYPLAHAGTRTLAVVGHTGCGAVGAAMNAVLDGAYPDEPGVRADVEDLIPIVERGLDDDAVAPNGADTANLHDRLVEHNVHEQVAFALETPEVRESGADVYGFVYDFHQTYGDADGATYLVNANGERDLETLRELADSAGGDVDLVRTLLD